VTTDHLAKLSNLIPRLERIPERLFGIVLSAIKGHANNLPKFLLTFWCSTVSLGGACCWASGWFLVEVVMRSAIVAALSVLVFVWGCAEGSDMPGQGTGTVTAPSPGSTGVAGNPASPMGMGGAGSVAMPPHNPPNNMSGMAGVSGSTAGAGTSGIGGGDAGGGPLPAGTGGVGGVPMMMAGAGGEAMPTPAGSMDPVVPAATETCPNFMNGTITFMGLGGIQISAGAKPAAASGRERADGVLLARHRLHRW
jgi:hypothetical protein